jgi:hypothetical protein
MANIDVNVDDFLSSCDRYDIKEIIKFLKDEEWISEDSDDENPNPNLIPLDKQNIYDQEWYSLCDKLSSIRLQLSHEDEETIRNILKKYY